VTLVDRMVQDDIRRRTMFER